LLQAFFPIPITLDRFSNLVPISYRSSQPSVGNVGHSGVQRHSLNHFFSLSLSSHQHNLFTVPLGVVDKIAGRL